MTESTTLDRCSDQLANALKAQGVPPTPSNIAAVAAASGKEPEAAMALLKEAGVSKTDALELAQQGLPRRSAILAGVLEGAKDAVYATAMVPVVHWATEGRASWRSFMKAAPRSAAVGLVFGAVNGVAGVVSSNRQREAALRELTAFMTEADAKWAEQEAKKEGANSSTRNDTRGK